MPHALFGYRPLAAIVPALLATGTSVAAAPSPHYVTIVHQADVTRPAGAVWARIGHYCDLTKWMGKPCEIVAGKDGEIGATRLIDHKIVEILVGRTATSYTYTQTDHISAPLHLYHGTLAVEPIDGRSSRIVYTLFYDNNGISDPTARAKEVQQRSALFAKAVKTMQSMAEAAPAS
ncbi:SRPBCC family protein [Sphingomonas abietis]|uniref:SRPBCC family protein n=1 Tax=Sphingomonas abietis TaxID=3012344 RepID=A0ABY7NTD4_9SPHN|nr:SRPBCC family protein [Sphingomonas abietis]WBO23701.1 SRPBCC family protein [Sphingomonas abietis]